MNMMNMYNRREAPVQFVNKAADFTTAAAAVRFSVALAVFEVEVAWSLMMCRHLEHTKLQD